MVKNVITSIAFQNENLNGQHHFLPFKVANIIAHVADNTPNQLQTNINTGKPK
jgi:hypothetical protein